MKTMPGVRLMSVLPRRASSWRTRVPKNERSSPVDSTAVTRALTTEKITEPTSASMRLSTAIQPTWAMSQNASACTRTVTMDATAIEMDGVSILTDPLLVDRLGLLHRHTETVAHLIEDVDVDVVLISHAHHDHLHLPSLRRLRGRPRVVVPKGLGQVVRRSGHDVVEVAAGERFGVGSVVVEAIRAEHDGRRRMFGPAAEALGYRI